MNMVERYKIMRLHSLGKEITTIEAILKFHEICPSKYRDTKEELHPLNPGELEELQIKLSNLREKEFKLTNFPFYQNAN